jgi:hypothetical protein
MNKKTPNVDLSEFFTKTKEGRQFFLRAFIHCASQGGPISPEMLKWVSHGLNDCLEEGLTFKKAFGLESGKGRKKTKHFEQKHLYVAAAVHAYVGKEGVSISHACKFMGEGWGLTQKSVKRIYLNMRKTDGPNLEKIAKTLVDRKAH